MNSFMKMIDLWPSLRNWGHDSIHSGSLKLQDTFKFSIKILSTVIEDIQAKKGRGVKRCRPNLRVNLKYAKKISSLVLRE